MAFPLLLFSLVTAECVAATTEQSIQSLIQKAQKGDTAAQCELGAKYLYGEGVTKDVQKAETWLKKAADKNYGEAYYHLGWLYTYDTKDDEKALYYIRKGASLGLGNCYYLLYVAYNKGRYGFKEDKKLAVKMLLKAGEHRFKFGCGKIFFDISVHYRYGLDSVLPKDIDKAIYWGKKSCDADYAEYLKTGMPRERDLWVYEIKYLKELGCDYDPALHVEEYQAWLNEKPKADYSIPVYSDSQTTKSQKTSPVNTSTEKLRYIKSGRGRSQSTGQWTDDMGSEECVVEFKDNEIFVNGIYQAFVKKSGKWKIYGGNGSWGMTQYYYVDNSKNMQLVCDMASQYGTDTFIYPMSLSGDPTPRGSNSSAQYNSYSNSSTSNVSSGSSSRHSNSYDMGGYKDCHICRGSGTCQTCNGSRYVTNYGNTSECPNCWLENMRRTGKCSSCQGKGKIFK